MTSESEIPQSGHTLHSLRATIDEEYKQKEERELRRSFMSGYRQSAREAREILARQLDAGMIMSYESGYGSRMIRYLLYNSLKLFQESKEDFYTLPQKKARQRGTAVGYAMGIMKFFANDGMWNAGTIGEAYKCLSDLGYGENKTVIGYLMRGVKLRPEVVKDIKDILEKYQHRADTDPAVL